MAAVFEDARLRFITAVGMPRNTDGARFMVANVNIDYLAQAYYPAGLECRVGVLPGIWTRWLTEITHVRDGPGRQGVIDGAAGLRRGGCADYSPSGMDAHRRTSVAAAFSSTRSRTSTI